MIKTILVPIDGSDHSNKAVVLAADIAEKYDAKLVMMNVLGRGPLPESLRRLAEVEHLTTTGSPSSPIAAVPEGRFPASTTTVAAPESERAVYEFIGQKVLNSAKRTAKERGVVRIETVQEEGDPVKRILERAEREEANLIIMGSRGLSDLKGLLMGSVSHKVSHLAPCSCITVR